MNTIFFLSLLLGLLTTPENQENEYNQDDIETRSQYTNGEGDDLPDED